MLDLETPRVPDDAEALFEEARQRARRRRRRIAAAVITVTALGALLVVLLVRAAGDDGSGVARSARAAGAEAGGDLLFLRVLPGDGIVRLDPRSGDAGTTEIRTACGDAPACLIATGGRLIVSEPGRTRAYEPSAPDRPTEIGHGWITVPSQTPGTLWLGILNRRHDSHDARLTAVREVDVDGTVLRSMRPPGGRWPVQAVEDGLLFQHADHLRLWSFATRRFTTRLPGAFPADAAGSTVASCPDPCPAYTITDLQTGAAQRIAPPPGYRWTGGYDGRFSPDATRLALPITDTAAPGRADALALVDLGSATARVVPGSDAVEPVYHALSWSTGGQRLFYAASRGRLRAYTLGEPRSTTVGHLPAGTHRVMQVVAVRRSP